MTTKNVKSYKIKYALICSSLTTGNIREQQIAEESGADNAAVAKVRENKLLFKIR